MRYITGIRALNLPSPDGTPGDWHYGALDWRRPRIADTDTSPFENWGIYDAAVPYRGITPTANHIRPA